MAPTSLPEEPLITPNFFLIGAPKCGTTSMAAWLSEHPDIFISAIKEPHYFSTDLDMPTRQNDYHSLFTDVRSEHLAIGEASTEYIYSDVAVEQVLSLQPRAKFVVMIRNPTDLVWSWHHQLLFVGRQPLTEFGDAWNASKTVRDRNGARNRYASRLLDYRYIGSLGTRLRKLLRQVSKEQVHVIVLDDMKKDSGVEYRRLLSFLGVNSDYAPSLLQPQHVGIARRSQLLANLVRRGVDAKTQLGAILPMPNLGLLSWVSRINKSQERAGRMDSELRVSISSEFLPEVKLLEELLNRRFDSWTHVSSKQVVPTSTR